MEKKKLRFDEDSPLPDRFELLAEIGRGAMSVVYRAYDQELEREVAVKLLPEGARGGQMSERYHREGRELARIQHANVVGFYGEGVHRGRDFLVLEYVSGGDLRRFLGRPRPRTELLQLFLGICRGLAELHSRGLVHRDLKPENVLIGADGEARLSDLGLVRSLSSNTHLTSEGALVGTLSYLSPEQILTGELSAAADLYALGACLYEAMVGRPLFDGRTEFEILQRHVRDEPVPPRDVVSDLDPEIEDLIMRLVSKDPVHRPSADECARVLAEYLLREARRRSDPSALAAQPDPPAAQVPADTPAPVVPPTPEPSAEATALPAQANADRSPSQPAPAVQAELPASQPARSAEPEPPPPARTTVVPATPAAPPPTRRRMLVPLLLVAALLALAGGNLALQASKTVQVTSTPPGARVLVDGRPRGRTPRKLSGLSLGSHEIRLELEGYQPFTGTLELAMGRIPTPLQATLEPQPRVRLSLDPADMRVLVDGRPAVIQEGYLLASPGKHQLEFSRADYFPTQQELELVAGQEPPPLTVSLKSATVAHLRLELNPPDAEVLLDGKPFQPGQELTSGSHQLQVRRKGYQERVQNVQLVAGQTLQLPLTLERARPTLKISSTPVATVYLNGQRRGKTPLTLTGLAPGKAQLKLTAPGFLTSQKRLVLNAGQDQSLSFKLDPIPPPPPPPPPPVYFPPPPAPYYPPPPPRPRPGPAPTSDF